MDWAFGGIAWKRLEALGVDCHPTEAHGSWGFTHSRTPVTGMSPWASANSKLSSDTLQRAVGNQTNLVIGGGSHIPAARHGLGTDLAPSSDKSHLTLSARTTVCNSMTGVRPMVSYESLLFVSDSSTTYGWGSVYSFPDLPGPMSPPYLWCQNVLATPLSSCHSVPTPNSPPR